MSKELGSLGIATVRHETAQDYGKMNERRISDDTIIHRRHHISRENQTERHRLMVLVDQVLMSAYTKVGNVVISVSQKIENAPETLRTASVFATNQESAIHGPIPLPSTSPTHWRAV